MTCPQNVKAPMRCPDLPEQRAALFALLPIGRAWQTNDGGPREGSTLYGYFSALAEVLRFTASRFCDLREEFFCNTAAETLPQWMAEYGLPGPCDPYPDLCEKVSALGGQRCEYFVDRAARAGWTVYCSEPRGICGAEAGCAEAGCAEVGGGYVPGSTRTFYCGAEAGAAEAGCDFVGALGKRRIVPQLLFRVDIAESTAYVGRYETQPMAGALDAGSPLACEPDISPLKCLLERIVPAHARVTYQIIPPPVFLMVDELTHLTDESGALILAE